MYLTEEKVARMELDDEKFKRKIELMDKCARSFLEMRGDQTTTDVAIKVAMKATSEHVSVINPWYGQIVQWLLAARTTLRERVAEYDAQR